MDFQHCPAFSSPSAWLNQRALDANIAKVNARLGDKKLRVASKSVRCIPVLQRIAQRSPAFVGLMSYSAQESLFLLEQGFEDLLCAYPSVDLEAIHACESLAGPGSKLLWTIDRAEHLQRLASVGQALGRKLRVCVELNLSMPLPGLYFGTRRSSIRSLEALRSLVQQAGIWKHCRLAAVMGYEAQIAGVATGIGQFSPRGMGIRTLQRLSARRVASFRAQVVQELQATHGPLEVVNGGGSGSLEWSAAQPELTEVAVGSAYFMPAYFSGMPTMQDFQPAAGFALPVTRNPSLGVITCQSGGFIASGPPGPDRQPEIVYPPGLQVFSLEAFGEVQTAMSVPSGTSVKIGDCVWLRHAKAGELCEHFNELHVFRGNEVIERYPTYRGQGKSFH